MKPEIPLYITALFIGLVTALFVLLITGANDAWKRNGIAPSLRKKKVLTLSIVLLAWLGFLEVISQLNVLNNFSTMPPRLLIVLLPPLIATIVLTRSKSVLSLLDEIPKHWTIIIQSFRILMEVILYWLFIEHIIPQQMTFEGRNFDIITGITGLIMGFMVYNRIIQSSKFIIAWNVMGLLLLANIVGIAILSAPFPFRIFMNEPANTVIAYFPFVWLPGFVVPFAFCMHVLSIKQCLVKPHSTSAIKEKLVRAEKVKVF